MPELVGRVLERYQILHRLGEDAWGEVFKAYDPKLDREVAVQVLYPGRSGNNKLNDQVLQMARTLLNWRHPGIIKIFDFGHSEALTFVVREFIPGANLRQLLLSLRDQGKWIRLDEAVKLAIQISQALEYAHQHGVPHADLQPENILLKAEPSDSLPYQSVLINLGFNHPGTIPIPTTEPAYRAREVSSGEIFDGRADIYSLGVLLYEMATGRLPGAGTAPLTYEGQPIVSPFPSPRLLRPDLPRPLDRAIFTALAPDPGDRFPDASAFTKALTETLPQVSLVATAPPGVKEAASLIPIFQLGLTEVAPVAPHTESPAKDLEAILDQIRQDRIHLLLPDGDTRSLFMKPEGITIGRGLENDLVIDQRGISRRHARIDFDGNNYLISDLDSLNGTFIEETRLEPDRPHLWHEGENVRLGSVWLRLERAGQAQTTAAVPTSAITHPGSGSMPLAETGLMFLALDGREVDPSLIRLSSDSTSIGVYCENLNLSVTPGGSTYTVLLVFNRSPVDHNLWISISGVPLEWVPKPAQSIKIPAGERRELQIVFTPPRSSNSRAGRHPIVLRIASQNSPDQFVELRPVLTVTAFTQFTCELRPSKLSSGQIGQLLVSNLGNLPETFTLVWEGYAQELSFDPPLLKVNIPAGQTAAVEYRVAPTRTRLLGGQTVHSFNVHVSSQAGQSQSQRGQMTSRGVIPIWAPAALIAMCVVLACFAVFFYNTLSAPARHSRQTAAAYQTLAFELTKQVDQVATQTATALAGANLATIQAGTATASWQNADDDQDGLSNSQEIQAGTLPGNPDTDQDGLKDGEEIYLWKTNPVVADTDGDGIKDGSEVEDGTNPLKKDTDGDGIEDATDPDPLHSPTKTPWIFPTFPPPPRSSTPSFTQFPPTTDLSISINDGQSSAIPGTNIIYTIIVTNRGPVAVTAARLTDTFPAIVSNITWTCVASSGARCLSPNGIGDINASLDLPVGGSTTLTANGLVSPSAVGLLANTASVVVPTGMTDLNPNDNSATDTDTLTPRVNLSITKTDNRTNIFPGQIASYIVTVMNSGPSAISGVSITDNFPDSLTSVSWTCSATTGSSCAASGTRPGNINTTISLFPNGAATFNANATVKNSATGQVSNTALINSPIDPLTNNKTATDTTTIIPQADLELEVSAPVTITTTSLLTYTVNITNNGPSYATNLILTDMLPAGVTFITTTLSAQSCTLEPGKVTCNLSNLPQLSTLHFEIVVLTPASPGPIANVVDIKAEEADPNPANSRATTVVQVY